MITDHNTSSSEGSAPTAPPTQELHVRLTEFPQTGPSFTISGNYLEMFWQSVLGPTSTAFVRYIARCEINPSTDPDTPYTPLDALALCVSLGIHKNDGGRSELPRTFAQTIERLARLRFVTVDRRDGRLPSHISVRSHVTLVPSKFRDRWPLILQDRHSLFVSSTVTDVPQNEAR